MRSSRSRSRRLIAGEKFADEPLVDLIELIANVRERRLLLGRNFKSEVVGAAKSLANGYLELAVSGRMFCGIGILGIERFFGFDHLVAVELVDFQRRVVISGGYLGSHILKFGGAKLRKKLGAPDGIGFAIEFRLVGGGGALLRDETREQQKSGGRNGG